MDQYGAGKILGIFLIGMIAEMVLKAILKLVLKALL